MLPQIFEFYAPWCGHCQNLKPAYEKAAKNLDGLAKVVAVDCDNEASKQFCGSMGVQGFPTLKIVRPSMKPGKKPIIEDYQGPRTATAIVEAVADKINNHVSRLTDKNLDDFLEGDKPKFVLFTNKGTTSALLRSVAIDYLDTMSVGQIRDKEKDAVSKFGVDKFPTLMLFPDKGKETTPIKFEGELKKKSLLQFLSQVGPPNPDPAPAAAKADKATKSAKAGKKKSASTKAPAACPVGSNRVAGTEPESSADTTSTKSAVPTPDIIPITSITTKDMLEEKCLQSKSYTCILFFVPSEASERGTKAIESLSRLNTKYIHDKRHLFPFFSVPSNVDGTSSLRDALKLESDVELIVVNARHGWWRQYEGDFGVKSVESVESWIDAIRMGEGQKAKLPTGVVVEAAETPKEQRTTEAEKATEAAEAEAETKTPSPKTEKVVHEEL